MWIDQLKYIILLSYAQKLAFFSRIWLTIIILKNNNNTKHSAKYFDYMNMKYEASFSLMKQFNLFQTIFDNLAHLCKNMDNHWHNTKRLYYFNCYVGC